MRKKRKNRKKHASEKSGKKKRKVFCDDRKVDFLMRKKTPSDNFCEPKELDKVFEQI